MVKYGLELSLTPTRSEIDTLTHWLGFFFVVWLADYRLSLFLAVIIAIIASIGLELAQKYAPAILGVGEKGSKPAPQVRDLVSDFLAIGLYSSMMTAGYQGIWDWFFTAGSFFWLLWQFIRATPRKHNF